MLLFYKHTAYKRIILKHYSRSSLANTEVIAPHQSSGRSEISIARGEAPWIKLNQSIGAAR